MFGRLPISLLLALVWSSLSNALVPADPTITSPAKLSKRQNDAAYIGWLSTLGTWTSVTCDAGATWFQEEKYAQCCPTTVASCMAPTACLSGTLIYPATASKTTALSVACTDAYNEPKFTECNSVFIFENFQDSSPKTDIVCGNKKSNWSYYRQIPATATQAPASSVITASASSTDQGNSATESPPPLSIKKKSKTGRIVGAVVGPLIGLSIIGVIAFFVRRKKKTPQPQPGAAIAVAPPSQETTETKPGFAEQGAYAPPITGYNPHDPYNHQQQQQQVYGQNPMTPLPQYSTPYNAPGSPPPQNAYPVDHKYGYNQVQESDRGFIAELGGGGEPSASAPIPQAAELGGGGEPAPHPQAAEMGDSSAPVASGSHTAELATEVESKTK